MQKPNALILTLRRLFTTFFIFPFLWAFLWNSAQASWFEDLSRLSRTGQLIESRLRAEIRQHSSVGEIHAIEQDFLPWRDQIEILLDLPSNPSPQNPSDAYAPVEIKLRAFNLYLNQVSLLANLRIQLDLPHDNKWLDAFALHTSQRFLAELGAQANTVQNRLGDRFQPFVIDRNSTGAPDRILIKLSISQIQGMEIAHLAEHPNNDTRLTMIQFMTVRQLLNNLSNLRFLKKNHEIVIPQIPSPLKDKLQTLGFASQIAQEQQLQIDEPAAHLGLLQNLEPIAQTLAPFVTDDLAGQLAAVFTDSPEDRHIAEKSLKELLLKAERERFQTCVTQELNDAGTPPLTPLPNAERENLLRTILANSKNCTAVEAITELTAKDVLDQQESLSIEKRQQIMSILDSRANIYKQQISAAAIQNWNQGSAQSADDFLFTQQRQNFIENLLSTAPTVVKKIQESYLGDVINVEALVSTLEDDLKALKLRSSVRQWISEVRHAETYTEAKGKYAQIMAREANFSVLDNNSDDTVLPERVRDYLDSHDFRPEIHFPQNISPAAADDLIKLITQGRKKDLSDFLSIGEQFGFLRATESVRESIRDILNSQPAIERYFRALDNQNQGMFPFLNTQVTVHTPQQANASVRLADALVALHPLHQETPDSLIQVEPLIDQALEKVEQQTRKNIQRIAQVTDIMEIKRIATSAMMVSLTLKAFPEFKGQMEDLARELAHPSISNQFMNRYVRNYMWGAAAVMLVHGANWVAEGVVKRWSPYSFLVMKTVDAVSASYMESIMGLILADGAYQFAETVEIHQETKQVEDFSQSSVLGSTSLFLPQELEMAQLESRAAWQNFFIRAAMDSVFMYLPMARGLLTRMGEQVTMKEFAENTRDLARLDLKPDEFSQVAERLEIARGMQKANRITGSPEAWAKKIEAGERLLNKIQRGRTYRLPNVYSEMLIRDAFSELGLSTTSKKSWNKINAALKLHTNTGRTAAQKNTAQRAAEFLKKTLEENPSVQASRGSISDAEIRLAKAIRHTSTRNALWNEWAQWYKKQRGGS
ncbi:hypothetical protein WDW37_07560 [Bdellovibrionota bacterium FG-1]